MANNDKIYLAYSGEMGEKTAEDAKMRIDWILKNIEDTETVLDIGCSQGIISILAAEKGKKVKGIDIQIESVDFARGLLADKYSHVSENVTFECIDFMAYEGNEQYDCIIITEVLEHLDNPSAFLQKAKQNLKEGGKMIISVPFGVVPHPDHKATYYLTNFIDLVEKCFSISSIEYMERWMGTVLYNCAEEKKNHEITKEQVHALEKNFERLDRFMSNRINDLYQNNMHASEKYKQSVENYQKIKSWYESSQVKNNELQNQVDNCILKYEDLQKVYTGLCEKEISYKDCIIKLQDDIKANEKMLKDALHDIEEKEDKIKSLEWEAGQYRRIRYSFLGKVVSKILRVIKRSIK